MRNGLILSLMPMVASLMFGFAAIPAEAQQGAQIKDSCKLVRDIKVKDITIVKGTTVQDGTEVIGVGGADKTISIKEWGPVCLINTVNSVVDWVFFILLAVSFALIAYAGFLWMTGGENTENQEKARTIIMGALVGILIAIVARIIPAVIVGILL